MPHFNFFYDVETSGNDPIRNGIIAFSLIVTDENNIALDRFNMKVCPPDLLPTTWSHGAESVHQISYETVKNQHVPNNKFCFELLCFMKKFLSNNIHTSIMHASPRGMPEINPRTNKPNGSWRIYPWFDYFFLEWAFRKAMFKDGNSMVYKFWKILGTDKLVSTVQMGRDAGFKKNKLSDWAERIDFKLNHHDAESDTNCLFQLYIHLEKLKNNDFVTIDNQKFTSINIPF